MRRELNHLAASLGIAFLFLALWTGVWSLIRAPGISDRPDNPRPFYAERRLRRGSILDRSGQPLVLSEGTPGSYERHWTVPEASPVTGTSSALFGRTGLEAALNDLLSGQAGRDPEEAWVEDLLLGGPAHGYDVRLTIDARLQRAAADSLNGERGAVVLLAIPSGDILVLASSPGFDPNRLELDWPTLSQDPSAPLLNRATLGLYQPGGSLEPIVLAAALSNALVQADSPAPNAGASLPIGERRAECASPLTADPGQVSIFTAFAHACPGTFAALGRALGSTRLVQAFGDAGLFSLPDILLETAAAERLQPAALSDEDVETLAIGQGQLTVSPLQMALVVAGLANHGLIPAPRLLAATQLSTGQWVTEEPRGYPLAATIPAVADSVGGLMAQIGRTPLGLRSGLSAIPAGGHLSTAVAGPQDESLTWFLGFAPTEQPQVAIVVLLEERDVDGAARIGAAVLRAGLENGS